MIEQGNAGNGELQNKRTLPASLGEVSSANGGSRRCIRQFLKQRALDSALLTRAKMMLSRGVKPGAAALLLRLPVGLLQELYDGSFNPRCRQANYKSARQQGLEIRDKFTAGLELEALCRDSKLPLFTVVAMLKSTGVNDHDLASRMPGPDHPLMVEYAATIERGKRRQAKGHHSLSI